MKISIFVRNKDYGPSCFYRIIQYIDLYKGNNNIEIHEYIKKNDYKKDRNLDNKKILRVMNKVNIFFKGTLNRYKQLNYKNNAQQNDVIFIQREIFPRYFPKIFKSRLLKYLEKSKIVIWDFDDNIMDNNEISDEEFSILSEYSDYIITTSEFLKNTIDSKYHSKVIYLPTTDLEMNKSNIDMLNSNRKQMFYKQIELVWVGTYSNLKYLEKIIHILDKTANKLNNIEKDLILNIVSNSDIKIKTKYLKIKNINWNREIAIDTMKKSHIGLMPLEINNYTLGKAGFKAVQYIGMGLPTIASDVGFNKNVIINGKNGFLAKNEDDWCNLILQISEDYEIWAQMSKTAKDLWNEKFNAYDVKKVLENIIFSMS